MGETIIETNIYQKSKTLIIDYLESNKSGSTSEILDVVSKQAKDCIDKVPHALLSLEKEGVIKKEISKEKQGFVWTLLRKI
jgi:hypothetical protein